MSISMNTYNQNVYYELLNNENTLEMEEGENIDAISLETKSQLSSDNLRDILVDMQSMLSSLSLERGENDSEGSDHTLISLQELLSDVDVSSASDEEITSLFDKWRKIVEQP